MASSKHLIYGFDPLCGWCYGFVPAMRAVSAAFPDLPVVLAMPGLVTGDRVGPYVEMESYIRGASRRLKDVTGRAPSDAFFDLITTPGVKGDSRPPITAIAQVARAHPDAALTFAHAVIEAHFASGADLNSASAYRPLTDRLGLSAEVTLEDPTLLQATLDRGRKFGITSFPTLALVSGTHIHTFPSEYDPEKVVSMLGAAIAG